MQELADAQETPLKYAATAPGGKGTDSSAHVEPVRVSANDAWLPELEANVPTATQTVPFAQLTADSEPLAMGGFGVGTIVHPELASPPIAVANREMATTANSATDRLLCLLRIVES